MAASNQLKNFKNVSDSISVNRYSNGWMVEINGNNKDDNWVNEKIVCNTEEQLFALIQEYNKLTLN